MYSTNLCIRGYYAYIVECSVQISVCILPGNSSKDCSPFLKFVLFCVLPVWNSVKTSASFLNLPLWVGPGDEATCGVAISPDDTVFVADNHCVKKFLNRQFIASVGSRGSGKLQFQYPWAIAYNYTNNRVYVCDTHNHRITILNHNLIFCSSFGSNGSEPGQFNTPSGIAVDAS